MRAMLFLLLACCLTSCGKSEPVTRYADATVGPFVILVELTSAHPFLNEYEKRVEIRRGAVSIATFSLVDPGGFAAVYIVEQKGRLLIVDGLVNGKVIDKDSGRAIDVNPVTVPDDFTERNVGQFRFVETAAVYQWVPNTGQP